MIVGEPRDPLLPRRLLSSVVMGFVGVDMSHGWCPVVASLGQ